MTNLFRHTMSISQFLQALGGLGMCFGIAFLLSPLMPRATISLQPDLATDGQVLGVTSQISDSETTNPLTENRLIIPTIGVDAPVHEGLSEATLQQGIWRIPESSTPDRGSNTVLTAHRWQRLAGPNTFYHLDNLVVGDVLSVQWQGQKYWYKVTTKFETTSDNMSIEQPTDGAILTLYTCELWWNSDKRLVVVAERI